MMQFCLIDRIVELVPGKHIRAVKTLRPDEDYLKDHFPLFPVMPGVLMLEAMYQASAWLVRESENFKHAGMVLKEARNVKYSDFVSPNQELIVTAEIIKQDDRLTTLKAQGEVHGDVAVSARLIVERFHIADKYPGLGPIESYCIEELSQDFGRLTASA
jgi:3-hydroxyacyl-[acyl-carrier-protein] dehydratase